MEAQKSAIVLAVGVCLTMAVSAALDGAARIVVQGVGVALLLIGVAVVAAQARKGARHDGDLWLPSRDEDKR
ncbi:hypothetical protein [Nocardioides sp. LML1-1-1.1]|uniref:hypothetical protein n=1 Tax=Nocardioides sp. LML1-1-1.1 TaxID=3135248 RepID=UPI003425EBEE